MTNWVDNNNNLWLFGGKVNNMGVGNDLWKYNIGTGLWTWVNGSNTLGSAGSYGTMGVAAASNQPPARTGYAGAVAANGNLLLFGGDNRNDVWEYNIVTNVWTWVAGTNIIGDNGIYNSYCQVGLPAARTGWHAVPLNPKSANLFYLFSGAADSLGNIPGNDLWLFDANNNTFKWLSGRFNDRADSNGLWGTIGVWHPYNRIPPRTDYAMWCDAQNNLWVSAGRTVWGKTTNDMWKYIPDTSCGIPLPPCSATYSIQQGNLCHATDSFLLPRYEYTHSAGVYHDTILNIRGCDSIITTTIVYHPPIINNQTVAICPHQFYTLPNGLQTDTAGVYYDTLQSHVGCDSLVITQVSLKTISTESIAVAICQGHSYTLPNGGVVNQAGTYTDTLQNYLGCDSIISVQLSVINNQQKAISASICNNQTYTLPKGEIVNMAGVYQDTLKTYLGCDSFINTTLTIVNSPMIDLGQDTSLCRGNGLVLKASYPNATYIWNDGSTQATQIALNSGTYVVQVTESPCAPITDSIRIHFIDCSCDMLMPNAFSPNNDAKDDDIKPIYACDLQPLDYSYKIFNRWGQLVFQTTDYTMAWDGTFNGKPQPIATYVYFISWKNASGDAHLKKGDVSLVR